ncbi:MAG: hypothetical protein KF812_03960 [Fimbriimonadaceae bacterium]|nr:hypothetical protein [Fimbriimonadaceae bacterium]
MPMSVTYATVNGRMVQENRGGTVTRYVADTLGSVIKTTDASGNVTSTTKCWPFGEVRTSTGTNPSPWGFVGTLGYFRDTLTMLFVQARTYRADLSRWMTVDPLWPEETAYGYCNESPVLIGDASGLGKAHKFFDCYMYLRYKEGLRLSNREICEACKRTLVPRSFVTIAILPHRASHRRLRSQL